nr:MAG TPA: hypothetical protein [Caudoviricetes sp.]
MKSNGSTNAILCRFRGSGRTCLLGIDVFKMGEVVCKLCTRTKTNQPLTSL